MLEIVKGNQVVFVMVLANMGGYRVVDQAGRLVRNRLSSLSRLRGQGRVWSNCRHSSLHESDDGYRYVLPSSVQLLPLGILVLNQGVDSE